MAEQLGARQSGPCQHECVCVCVCVCVMSRWGSEEKKSPSHRSGTLDVTRCLHGTERRGGGTVWGWEQTINLLDQLSSRFCTTGPALTGPQSTPLPHCPPELMPRCFHLSAASVRDHPSLHLRYVGRTNKSTPAEQKR